MNPNDNHILTTTIVRFAEGKGDVSQSNENNRGAKVNFDLLMVGGLLLGWFALQTFVLPGLGVST